MIFIDMDGVLAVYEPKDYMGNPMPFEKPGIHYFAHRKPDPAAKQLLVNLTQMLPPNQIIALSTISENAANNPGLEDEHRSDKRQWLDMLCKRNNIPTPPLFFAIQGLRNKPKTAIAVIEQSLRPTDILIDDWNSNLTEWEQAGGTGVKWLNGLNDEGSWAGRRISRRTTWEQVRDIVEELMKKE